MVCLVFFAYFSIFSLHPLLVHEGDHLETNILMPSAYDEGGHLQTNLLRPSGYDEGDLCKHKTVVTSVCYLKEVFPTCLPFTCYEKGIKTQSVLIFQECI